MLSVTVHLPAIFNNAVLSSILVSNALASNLAAKNHDLATSCERSCASPEKADMVQCQIWARFPVPM